MRLQNFTPSTLATETLGCNPYVLRLANEYDIHTANLQQVGAIIIKLPQGAVI